MEELGARPDINYVQVFENKGASWDRPTPTRTGRFGPVHSVPLEPAKEDVQQRAYYDRHGRAAAARLPGAGTGQGNVRVVIQNRHWVVLVPYWAVWPFEVLLLPRRHVCWHSPTSPTTNATRWPTS
jgi:UDPglucose--hexose-1-phosphate uridylyltransferase